MRERGLGSTGRAPPTVPQACQSYQDDVVTLEAQAEQLLAD
jgi:hypothetical protein